MDWIVPMEPILSSKLITESQWIHQVKWDGIRGLSYISSGELKIYTKKGNERTLFYPEFKELLNFFKGKQVILDGEIVIFDDNGNPSFHRSLVRERIRKESNLPYYTRNYPAKYIIFDILHLDGKDLTAYSLKERIKLLQSHIIKSPNITITDDFTQADPLLDLMKTKGWEGIVSKNNESPYISGKRHKLWYKTKLTKKILAVVGGIQWKDSFPNALLLGIYQEEKLRYIGKASVGLKQRDFHVLKEYSKELISLTSPFSVNLNPKATTWIKPFITCWVSFSEWTNGGHLRHPKITGFHGHKPEEADGKEYVE